ncbi:hypothetical protein [Rhodanobacter sp. DHB23]|uniref:hypothetical protein n=1 Tax=Rhodanobacter sp. DHB23 TaxID=2775923 RepID=UPI0017811CB2|nr:hypothetical protein [Rhodanobacter sp. DHB23]MBD8874653.1 hypothetical protein [Rhodanobacter sp. DHB23]
MTNVEEFELLHPVGLRIARALTEDALLSSFQHEQLTSTDMHTGWVWYRLPAFAESNLVIGVSLGFNSGVLEQVSLSDTHPKYGTNWNTWSEERELARAEQIGSWLAGNGFAPGTYPWGSIWAGYDAKSGFGHAVVRYAA